MGIQGEERVSAPGSVVRGRAIALGLLWHARRALMCCALFGAAFIGAALMIAGMLYGYFGAPLSLSLLDSNAKSVGSFYGFLPFGSNAETLALLGGFFALHALAILAVFLRSLWGEVIARRDERSVGFLGWMRFFKGALGAAGLRAFKAQTGLFSRLLAPTSALACAPIMELAQEGPKIVGAKVAKAWLGILIAFFLCGQAVVAHMSLLLGALAFLFATLVAISDGVGISGGGRWFSPGQIGAVWAGLALILLPFWALSFGSKAALRAGARDAARQAGAACLSLGAGALRLIRSTPELLGAAGAKAGSKASFILDALEKDGLANGGASRLEKRELEALLPKAEEAPARAKRL